MYIISRRADVVWSPRSCDLAAFIYLFINNNTIINYIIIIWQLSNFDRKLSVVSHRAAHANSLAHYLLHLQVILFLYFVYICLVVFFVVFLFICLLFLFCFVNDDVYNYRDLVWTHGRLKRVIVVWRSPLQSSIEWLSSNCNCLCNVNKKWICFYFICNLRAHILKVFLR